MVCEVMCGVVTCASINKYSVQFLFQFLTILLLVLDIFLPFLLMNVLL